MTLNGMMTTILHYFTEFGTFWGQSHVTVVEVRPILSAARM